MSEASQESWFRLHLLLQELRNQTELALAAWTLVEAGVVAQGPNDAWMLMVWGGLQSFATCHANISKLFFRVKGAPERKGLIALFSALDLGPLRDRSMRDSFDHFDERVEGWVSEYGGQEVSVQDRAVGSDIGAFPRPHQLRRFDPATRTLIIWSRAGREESYALDPVLSCIRALALAMDAARAELSRK